MTSQVLLVEDDNGLRTLMKEVLEMENLTVADFGSGEPALKFMRTNGLPKVIIVDLKIPDLDPMTFRNRLNELEGGDKIALVVASGDSKIQEWAQRLNALSFIKKPYDIDVFTMTVLSIIDLH